LDTARAYWTLLISQGSKGKALKAKTEDEDVDMMGAGWQDHYTQWWFDFLNEKGARGVSRDTWVMVRLPLPRETIDL
jgi:DCN1-like protein 1/2